MQSQNIGKIGENLAREYLVNKGYRILERNYRTKWDEIDIICKAKDETLVFIEVKTLRDNPSELIPEDNLTSEKFRKISRACRVFSIERSGLVKEDKGWRIDLVTISIGSDGKEKIRHYENI